MKIKIPSFYIIILIKFTETPPLLDPVNIFLGKLLLSLVEILETHNFKA